jgi:hypothetical protein
MFTDNFPPTMKINVFSLMESYCSLCTFKVPQGANNLILCTLDTIHRLFFVTRLIINKINKVQWVKKKVLQLKNIRVYYF